MEESSHFPKKTLFVVWGCLLAFTALTIRIAGMDLGFINIVAALSIASAKAGLVIFFFMDLRHEGVLFRNILFVALFVLCLFFGLTYFDIGYRY